MVGTAAKWVQAMKRTPLARSKPLQARKPMNKVSAKRKAKKASAEGQAGLEHMARVAQLPCVICGAWPVHVHHCFHGRYGARKASDFDTIPLCPRDHLDGPEAIHRDKSGWMARNGPDYSYLDRVKDALSKL